jgi:nucleoside-diphosphate-sugar epimerase
LSQKNILITGATGAIGLEIIRQLEAKNMLDSITVLARDSKKNHRKLRHYSDRIKVIYGDVTNKEKVEEAVKNQDVIFHLAAVIPTIEDENKELIDNINTGGTRNVVEATNKFSPEAFLLFSSSVAIYGDRLKDPMIKVEDEPRGLDHDLYSNSKVEAEKLIRNSSLDWSIFRLTAIMGIGNHKVSGTMFEMPLDTPMEFATVRDTARAFVHSIDHLDDLRHKTYNLSGGEQCRIIFRDFITRAFHYFGMGKVNFPKYAFANQNFHCGYFSDADVLEDILKFRSDNVESYFERFRKSVPLIQRWLTIPFAWIVKRYLLTLSKPYKAYKSGDKKLINFYFGE